MLENDPTLQIFKFTLNTLNNNNNEVIDKIKRVLVGDNEVEIGNEEEMKVFADFGLVFGNDDFVSPLNNKLMVESELISTDNVVRILNMKRIFNIKDIEKEVSFIAQNFDSLSTNEQFILFSRNGENFNATEKIITSNSLQMKDEDVLLSFLLSICKNNEEIESLVPLFENLFLEYCSADMCKEFISFVNDIAQTHNMKTLISCIGRRLTQPNIPMKKGIIKGRHETKITGTEIKMDDPLNGILRRENQKSNVLMEASSTHYGDVYNLLKADPNAHFHTYGYENSFVKASLKDGKKFILKNYMIRGNGWSNNSCYQLKNWKLEGLKASNGEWILLDRHSNEPLDRLGVKTFDISFKEELEAVKLTQEGMSTSNSHQLIISGFDIFGVVINKN